MFGLYIRTLTTYLLPPFISLFVAHATCRRFESTLNRDLEQHDFANTCMDDFLSTKEDARWTEGVQRLPPEQRAIAAATLAVQAAAAKPGTADGSSGGTAAAAAAGGGEGAVSAAATGGPRLGKLRGLGGVAVEEEEEEADEEEDELHDMEHHNEYLRDKPVCAWLNCVTTTRQRV